MSISSETAIMMATCELGSTKLSENLRYAKHIFDINNNRNGIFAFSQQDINFHSILEIVPKDQRERDIIYISHFYHNAYSDINISWHVCKNQLNDAEVETINKVVECMNQLNVDVNLLLCDDLKGKIKTVLEKI